MPKIAANKTGTKWEFLNKSVQGASHKRKDVTCQDYTLCSIGEKGELPVILTVSDGHGGAKYVRSAQGAVFACEAAVSVFGEYSAVLNSADTNVIKQLTETRLKLDVVKRWQASVVSHVKANPFSAEELELMGVSAEECQAALCADISKWERLLAAYGATLLICIILDNVIICEQIGDGDIMFYYKNSNEPVLFPMEKDDRILGNETTSLCSLKAPFYFRHNVTYLYENASIPDLIMLTSDGYGNSFGKNEDYLKTAADYYEMLMVEGVQFVNDNISEWLDETSNDGSGDDITVALAWRS